MLIDRKHFIRTGSLATASLMIPRFLQAFEQPASVPSGNKVVVVIQLSGGNDGLNTVIPVRNDIYYRERQQLGIRRTDALPLTDEAGLHPALTAFRALHEEGHLAVYNGVGYPNPDKSHFRSMDIWHSASDSQVILQTGWLGRYLDAKCAGSARPTKALEVDDTLSLALKGAQVKGLAVTDPRRLFASSGDAWLKTQMAAHHAHEEAPVDYLYKTMAQTLSSAEYIFRQSRQHPTSASYPDTELAKGLKTIASLIYSEIDTKVYYISLGSFDTHVNQDAQQRRLFNELNGAVKAFTDDLKANGRFNDLLLFTFSEFGRRVKQNASNGTDHGKANNMFLISGALKNKGLLNPLPDLSRLDDGDLAHTLDFRQVYATVLERWLETGAEGILGKQFELLDFI
jgi:uncharacterized protein (DUF1501 family)